MKMFDAELLWQNWHSYSCFKPRFEYQFGFAFFPQFLSDFMEGFSSLTAVMIYTLCQNSLQSFQWCQFSPPPPPFIFHTQYSFYLDLFLNVFIYFFCPFPSLHLKTVHTCDESRCVCHLLGFVKMSWSLANIQQLLTLVPVCKQVIVRRKCKKELADTVCPSV